MLDNFFARLAIAPNIYFSHAFVSYCVPIKHRYLYPVTATIAIEMLWYLNTALLPSPSIFLYLGNVPVGAAILYFFAPKDQKLRALLSHAVLMAAEAIVRQSLLLLLGPVSRWLQKDPVCLIMAGNPLYPCACFVRTLLCCAAMYLCARMMRRSFPVFGKIRQSVFWAVIPFSQLLMVFSQYYGEYGFRGGPETIVLCILACILAELCCIFAARNIREWEKIEQNLEQMKSQLAQQVSYYRNMQEHILEINQVRHDLNNQLDAAFHMLKCVETEAVRKQLCALHDTIRDRVGTKYCENMIVDAVLVEKAEKCREKGIQIDICAMLPMDLPIEAEHLCSIFSNLLDNGIQGIQEKGTDAGKIVLHADIQKGVLLIRCFNPAVKPAGQTDQSAIRQHGLGLEILQSIAGQYHGSFVTEFRNGVFSATMCIRLSDGRSRLELTPSATG